MYISVMASVHNWGTISCWHHVTARMSNVIFKFTFYIYIYIYYDLLFTVIHTLFVWVGNRKYYTQYIVFSFQFFLIFFLFFVYLSLYFSYIFQKMFQFFLLYFSIQVLEGLRTVLLQNISRTESPRVGFHIWTNLGSIGGEFLWLGKFVVVYQL